VVLNGDDSEAEFIFDEDVETGTGYTINDFVLLLDEDGDGDDDPVRITADVLEEIDDETVTVSFTEDAFNDDDEEDNVVRAIVPANTVQDVEGDSRHNLDQSLELNEDTNSPTLTGVEIDAEDDEAVFKFSEQVDLQVGATHTKFDLYDALGTPIVGTGATAEDNEVTVSYADDTFEDDDVVLAVVEDDAVVDDDDATLENEGPQSLALDAATFAAGSTIGPDLEGATLGEDLDSFGEVQGLELRLDFDEDLDDDDITESSFTGYEVDGDSNGSIIASGDCDIDSDDDSVVVCTIDEDEAEDIVVVVLEQNAVTDGTTGNYPVAVGLES
jgi:hypothetical protein